MNALSISLLAVLLLPLAGCGEKATGSKSEATARELAPTFANGDVFLVGTGIKEPVVEGVYILAVRDQLYIKRVSRRFDGKHEISSDNPSVKTVEELNGDHPVEVKGRVVWAWKGERL